eukprot:Em0006g17a
MIFNIVTLSANGQSFLCDAVLATPLCPGTSASCTCALVGETHHLTQWTFQYLHPCVHKFDRILLTQVAPCSTYTSTGTCGAFLTAANRDPAIFGAACNSSVLTITADLSIHGLGIQCQNLISGAAIGNASLSVLSCIVQKFSSVPPGGKVILQTSMMCTNSLVLQWTPASGTHTSYSINVTSGTTVGTWSVAGDTTMTTIGDLIDGTNYTVSVTAINCAGSSNSSSVSVQTFSVNVTTVLYQNNSVHDVELFWTHRQQSCSVPQYTVMVTSATSTNTYMVANTYCTSSSCLYILGMSGANVSSYNVSVACRNTRNQIGQPFVTSVRSLPPPTLEIGYYGNTATIPCTFLDGSSHYCMVCCSTDPSVPSHSSVYNISTTRGTEVTVSLQGLTSGQMYYCKAAATNTNSNNCAGPVVGATSRPLIEERKQQKPLQTAAMLKFSTLVIVGAVFIVGQANGQSFSCDAVLTTPLCPGTSATCVCGTIPGLLVTQWSFLGYHLCPQQFDHIQLIQFSPCSAYTSTGTCGAFLTAANRDPAIFGAACNSSVLTITADLSIHGLGIQCQNPISGAVIGNASLSVLLGTWSVAGDTTMTTIGDLIDGTNYTVSVAAINCAGSSNSSSVSVQTFSVNVTTVLYQNNSVHDVELFWTHRQQSCSVPQYTVMVTSATSTDTYNNCTSSSCLYILGMSGANVSSYNVSVACRNTRNQIGQPFVTSVRSLPPPTLEIGYYGNTATIPCTFLDGSSHYCMVCCSTDPSVPPHSSVYNISTTRGTEVTVSLQGLTSSQMYYCKAAATNTNPNNCAGPVVGGVKVFFSMTTPAAHTAPLDGFVAKQLAEPLIVMCSVLIVVAMSA